MKKTRYFTSASIQRRSQKLLDEVRGFRARHPMKLFPERSALLILDMQRYFLDESFHAYVPSAPAIVPGLAKLAGLYTDKGLPVVLTRHLNSDNDAGMMDAWWHDRICEGTRAGSEIIPELSRFASKALKKTQYDAFHQTALEESLREKGATQVIVCGVMTHLCCESTARSAFIRGFEVFFAVDGTATYNVAFHRAALLNLSHGFAVPVGIDEIVTAAEEI